MNRSTLHVLTYKRCALYESSLLFCLEKFHTRKVHSTQQRVNLLACFAVSAFTLLMPQLQLGIPDIKIQQVKDP